MMDEMNNVDVTVFDKSKKYIPTEDEALTLMERVKNLLVKYGFKTGDNIGLMRMYGPNGIFWQNKGWLIDAFRRHPNYNGNMQIVIPNMKMNRRINRKDINEFFDWAYEHRDLMDKNPSVDYNKWWDYLFSPIIDYVDSDMDKSLLSKTMAERLTYNARTIGLDLKFFENQRVTKALNKIGKASGLSNVVEMKPVNRLNADGTSRQVQKDFGWNYQFAKMADAINPLSVDTIAVISCNPLDFYTMSFGDSWSSCHTIDKDRIRRNEGNGYGGEYCAGTQSYALDPSTIIFYYLPNNFEGEHPEEEDKIKRCVFFIGEDKLIQSRVYPDGRDGGIGSFAEDIRKIVQKVISDIFNVPNLWSYRGGTETASDEIITANESQHYRDYNHYSDVGTCYLKRVEGQKNHKKIVVGYKTICIDCGCRRTSSRDLVCDSCRDKALRTERCSCCGNMFKPQEGMRDRNGDFICFECGVRCADCGEWVARNNTKTDFYNRMLCITCIDEDYRYLNAYGAYFHIDGIVTTEEGTEWPIGSNGYSYCSECHTRHDTSTMRNNHGLKICARCRVSTVA